MKIKLLLLVWLLALPLVYAQDTIKVPLFGEISLSLPLPVLGMILGFVDGAFNPCALSVLFFLVAYLMSLGSRKKSLILGITYCLMVFLVYFSFMYGISFVLSLTGYIQTIKKIVGVIVIALSLIELKDFFFYGKWFSLEIPKFAKPKIERLVNLATIPSAILLGLFVSFVEIPCAGVFPFVYTTILVEKASSLSIILYLLWYNLFFIFPLIFLTFVFYFGLIKVERAEQTRKKMRRYMRLVSGIIMFLLGIWLIWG